MVKFVNLMEGLPIKLNAEHEKMEMFWESNDIVLEPIIEGKRVQCLINDRIQFSSSYEDNNPRPIDEKIPDILEKLSEFPKNTLFDGYITCSKNPSKTIQILTSNLERAKDLEEQFGKLKFILMDIIYYENDSIFQIPLIDRKELLKKIKKDFEITETYFDKKYEIYKNLKNDYEAFYFKKIESIYCFKRSSTWRLFKEPKSFFVVVLNVNKGTGQFENMCGSLEVGQYENGKMKKLTNISGLKNQDRIDFFQDKKKIIGKVVEIKAKKRTKNKFAEARFFKVREDKDPKECIFEKGE